MMDLTWANLGTVAGAAALVTIVVGVLKVTLTLKGQMVKVLTLLLGLILGLAAAFANHSDVFLGICSGFVIAATALGIHEGGKRAE
jgi:hypothetical protein